MSGESLPALFWIMHYLFLAVTLGTTIFFLIKKEMVILSMLTLLAVIIVPFIGFINSISRMEGTEYDYIKEALSQGAFWAISVTSGYIIILFWWSMLIRKKIRTRHELET